MKRSDTQRGVADDPELSFVRASNLAVTKVRHFFVHSRALFTKRTRVTLKFKKLEATARFKNKIWCLGLAFVDKPVKGNHGVNNVLVSQDFFGRSVDAS